MNHHLSGAVAVINSDVDHPQRLNSGVVQKCMNEYLLEKLSDEKQPNQQLLQAILM